jgi:hypothetical protein
MRADAVAFLDVCLPLPRYEDVQNAAADCHRNLLRLIPEVEQLAGRLPDDDIPAKVAQAGVAEARRRLYEIEAVGLDGEVKRVQRLARSVLALCDHHDSLTGLTMCLVCDDPIQGGEESQPYDKVSPSGGVARAGRIHAKCAQQTAPSLTSISRPQQGPHGGRFGSGPRRTQAPLVRRERP